MDLSGKVAVVTGSTKGIGRGIAEEYARRGARVVITGRDPVAGAEVLDACLAAGAEARFITGDLGLESEVEALIAGANDAFGGVDVLVNNAAPVSEIGAGGDGPVEGLSTEKFDHMLKVSLYAPFWACRAVIPVMRARGGGSIINVSSLVSQNPQPSLAAYSTAKAGLNGLTRQIACEYAPAGIRSNGILVGVILSGEFAQLVASNGVFRQAIDGMGLVKYGEPEDIARLAAFLAADESQFITGALIAADGGLGAKSQVPDFSSLVGELHIAGSAP